MNWMLALILVIACVICLMLGITAGVNLNPASTVVYVWDWNAAGSWVSGIGTLLAVIVTLWQVRRQQEREKPRLAIQQDYEAKSYTLIVVSTGLVPATVLGARLSFNGGKTFLDLAQNLPEDTAYPRRLDRGEVMSLLALRNVGFSMLGKSIIRPVISALESEGVRSAIHGEGLNRKFFDQLNSLSLRGAVLLVKMAHGVEQFNFSQEAFHALLKCAIDDEHNQALERLEYWKARDQETFNLLEAARQRIHKAESKTE